MAFYETGKIAEDLQKLLEDSKLFADVKVAAITSYKHLFSIIPGLAKFPVAIVCIGYGSFNSDRTSRTVNPGIVIVDKFKSTAERSAISIWDVLDKTGNLFYSEQGPRKGLKINGARYWTESFRPLALDGKCAAYLLELKAVSINN